ncbi:MAG: DUF58 domain-containing protein [Clostridia bacterium]|nr:DUF58 domain-containing protein [Clostridia bacterium]
MAQFTINEEFLQQIELLQTLIKNNIAGQFGGNHQTRTYGSSCEFADYRDYLAGDDVTKIDWNAYARFDKLYLKLFLDERQMHTKIYIDASRSMEFGDKKKAEQALKIAAALAYLSVCQMDKVSVYAIKDKAVHEVIGGIVGKEAYIASIHRLNEVQFDGDSFISDAIMPLNVGYGDGISVLISDFLTDNDYENAIDLFTDKKRDVFCVQILSQEELDPVVRGRVHFFDSENAEKFYRRNIDREIARAYKRALEWSIDRIKNYCAARGASYLLVEAEESLGRIFLEKLVNMGVLK